MLIIRIHNDGTGTNESANYTYEVRVNHTVLVRGKIKRHNRNHGWRVLLQCLLDATKPSEIQYAPERRHINSMGCWCHPEEIFEADNGSKVIVHKGHGEELPPPSIIAEAIAGAIKNA